MFSKDDYKNYLVEIQAVYRRNVESYTDLIGRIDDKSYKNRFLAMASDDMEAFEILNRHLEKFK